MASITYEHVWKRFGEVVAVQDLDVFVEDKEFLVFVGPSGCGKSTTLRMIAGLESITAGQLWIDGVLANELRPADRGAAMVFQSLSKVARTLCPVRGSATTTSSPETAVPVT